MKFKMACLICVLLSACATEQLPEWGGSLSDATPLTGTWVGTYTCAQGETGLKLFLVGSEAGAVEGTFLFYPLPTNARAATGKYIVRGWYYSNGSLFLSPGAWIEQPMGYVTVGLRGHVDLRSHSFNGVIPECHNDHFSVKKLVGASNSLHPISLVPLRGARITTDLEN